MQPIQRMNTYEIPNLDSVFKIAMVMTTLELVIGGRLAPILLLPGGKVGVVGWREIAPSFATDWLSLGARTLNPPWPSTLCPPLW